MARARAGKQWIFFYNLAALWRAMFLPGFIRRIQRRLCLRGWRQRPDAAQIESRVDYYFPLRYPFSPGPGAKRIDRQRLRGSHSVYWYDLMRYLRSFAGRRKIEYINGDTLDNPGSVVFGKARRLDEKAGNVALMNLDRRRHFLKVEDPIPFEDKRGMLIFRGDVDAKDNRRRFLERWHGHPLFDLGDTSRHNKSAWHTSPMKIEEHFSYKYVLALEGYDVASALQWIMASNCIPVMPRPTAEGWLMHGALIPGIHYIEIADDFSDAEEQIAYYNSHPDEAKQISEASKEWARQFEDKKRESIISYLVAERYLMLSGGGL
ncbi:MAG: lipopolysaccharide biosynthesis protein [Muribaculaceae bacterium]|nr:lipopolysaccharide biosynthesis protein [Muribaculaceae bacterium]